MEKHKLSKSTFIRGLQCTKSLFLYKNHIDLRDKLSDEKKAIFNRGSNVGVLAQNIFPGGIDASPDNGRDYVKAVLKTQELILAGYTTIYEAAFQKDGVLCIMDIIVNIDGKWFAYEVKSSAKITATYITDAALQYWVITGSGVQLEDIFIVNMNTSYIKKGAINVKQLFNITSVKKEVLSKQNFINENIQKLIGVADSGKLPEISIGEHCFSPYECDFKGLCWKNIPRGSVFEIGGISKAQQFDLYNQGIIKIEDIPTNNNLNGFSNLQINSIKTNSVFSNKDSLNKFLKQLVFPLFFVDFETFMPAIPIYDGTRPYENIPFQFSCHKMDKEGKIIHEDFLAETGKDPRSEFLKMFLEKTKGNGSIIVYDSLMEKGVINDLCIIFPDHKTELTDRLDRVVDLMKPFMDRDFYHPAFKGSVSLKTILPVLVPELSYSTLKISSGNIAMTEYENLQKETDLFKIMETREALLEYCKMDTLAMIKIYHRLNQEVSL